MSNKESPVSTKESSVSTEESSVSVEVPAGSLGTNGTPSKKRSNARLADQLALAGALCVLRAMPESDETYSAAITECKAAQDWEGVCDACCGAAFTFQSHGEFTRAAEYFECALAVERDMLGYLALSVVLLTDYARACYQCADYDRAVDLLQMALDRILTQDDGLESPEAASCLHNLGVACLARGSMASARAAFQQAYDLRCLILGEGHVDTLSTAEKLTVCQRDQVSLPLPPSGETEGVRTPTEARLKADTEAASSSSSDDDCTRAVEVADMNTVEPTDDGRPRTPRSSLRASGRRSSNQRVSWGDATPGRPLSAILLFTKGAQIAPSTKKESTPPSRPSKLPVASPRTGSMPARGLPSSAKGSAAQTGGQRGGKVVSMTASGSARHVGGLTRISTNRPASAPATTTVRAGNSGGDRGGTKQNAWRF